MTESELERRKDRKQDHDLLVSHTVKFDQIFDLCSATNKKLDSFVNKIDDRCGATALAFDAKCTGVKTNVDTKISNKLFLWMMGLMITAMLILASTVANTNINSSTNKTYIDVNSAKIAEQAEIINKLHQRAP